MKDVGEEKIGESNEELEIESEEKERGEKIEIDEDRLPSRAMAIHEHIRQDGEKEMERDAMALLWSAIAAGLSMGASLLAKGIFHVQLEGVPGGFLLENLGYTFGFIIVIMARQQLFTENTVTAVLPPCNSVICLQSQLSKIKLPVGPFYFMIMLDLAHLCNICLVWHTTKFQFENGEN